MVSHLDRKHAMMPITSQMMDAFNAMLQLDGFAVQLAILPNAFKFVEIFTSQLLKPVMTETI